MGLSNTVLFHTTGKCNHNINKLYYAINMVVERPKNHNFRLG